MSGLSDDIRRTEREISAEWLAALDKKLGEVMDVINRAEEVVKSRDQEETPAGLDGKALEGLKNRILFQAGLWAEKSEKSRAGGRKGEAEYYDAKAEALEWVLNLIETRTTGEAE